MVADNVSFFLSFFHCVALMKFMWTILFDVDELSLEDGINVFFAENSARLSRDS